MVVEAEVTVAWNTAIIVGGGGGGVTADLARVTVGT